MSPQQKKCNVPCGRSITGISITLMAWVLVTLPLTAYAQLTAVVAVEPTAKKAANSIMRATAEAGMSKAAGQPVALSANEDLAEVMRATRSAGHDIFIGPPQVAA